MIRLFEAQRVMRVTRVRDIAEFISCDLTKIQHDDII